MSAKILVVEDDLTINELVSSYLRDAGYHVENVHDGSDGLDKALAQPFDLILLDLMLPSMDGLDVLDKIRQRMQTPVLILTARGGEEDRIRGFRSGADDYLIKPFSLEELGLRIEAILRRCRPQPLAPRTLSAANIFVDGDRHYATAAGQPLTLTPIEFQLLKVLMGDAGKILSKPYLYQAVLDREFSRYDRTLDMHISKIRKKLRDMGLERDIIMTVHGRGYKLVP